MRRRDFAQARTDVSAAEAAMGTHLLNGHEGQEEPPLQWALLIDDAFDHDGRRFLRVPGQVNLYECDALEGLASAAPRLVPLPANDEGRALLRRALVHCSGRPMLSVIGSAASPQALKTHWEPLHWVDTEDGQQLLLRWADTRVLPTLPHILDEPQWARLAQPVSQWLYIDREGQPATAQIMPSAVDNLPPLLALTNAQLNAFIAAAQPDAMVEYMREQLPDALPEGTTLLTCYHWAVEVCQLADVHGVEAWSDRIALLCAQALTRGRCSRDPALAVLLSSQDWQAGQLGDALVAQGLLGEGV